MEIDQVVVNKADWAAMKGGDDEAMERIRKAIDEKFIYFHILSYPDDTHEPVTLRDLEEFNVIEGIRIEVKERAYVPVESA